MSSTIVLSVLLMGALYCLSGVDALPPNCVSSSCCNYCNETYIFTQNDCTSTFQSVLKAGNTTKNYELGQFSNYNYIDMVHTTISTCCPPGFHYKEDMSFTFSPGSQPSQCVVVGFSHSRDGTCDLGQDKANIDTIIVATGLHTNGGATNSGCQK
mmetsp:Transcript_52246/g.86839  ORF Transcript_52246/g.86839 Transcript_52246/m.86839 type:complete len:155 (+) Transcript_52246:71-535(+)